MSVGAVETRDCADYAARANALFKFRNARKPRDIDEATKWVQEYNKEILSFKELYGYSIRGFIPAIVDCMI